MVSEAIKSRQQRWQEKHKAMGLCVNCSEPLKSKVYCARHLEIDRLRGREKYRLRKAQQHE